jgi:hypothetical protein
MEKNHLASLSLKGGRKDNFFFCLMEYYADKDRWFLKSLLQVKDGQDDQDSALEVSREELIKSWTDKYQVKNLIVDFPLSAPPFNKSLFSKNPSFDEPGYQEIKNKMVNLLALDEKTRLENPKRYEQERNEDDLIEFSNSSMDRKSSDPMLSRPFKRRLKRGFLPYWNRPIDFWVWCEYFDPYLECFRGSFDSFGDTSLMTLLKFSYMKQNFDMSINLYEGNTKLTMLELLRAKIIQKKDILGLGFLEESVESRLDMVRKIERALKIFIYDHDLELIVKNPRAFESFLLCLSGQAIMGKKTRPIPDWAKPSECKFIVPEF